MIRKVQTVEVDGEGLISLLGEKVLLLCSNYFYYGELSGVNDTCVMLKDPHIVYETGEWADSVFKDSQKLPTDELGIMLQSIESFGVFKK